MEYTKDDLAYIWLSSINGLSNRKKHRLMDFFDSPREILEAPLGDDVIGFTGEEFAKKLIACRKYNYLDDLLYELDKMRITAVPFGSRQYPNLLREIVPPPLCLYCKGNVELMHTPCLGVVGTRNCTKYGREVTEKFVADLAVAGMTIVSGMARGLDGVAHDTALKSGGNTIAVLASGVDVIYPPEHKDLYGRIVERGLVLSEYLPRTAPQTYQFPERNRLISGLSNGVLVTEAGKGSGALITLEYALEQNRDIFIVPGNITSKASAGSNEALRYTECALALNANDILSKYHMPEIDVEEESDVKLDVMEEKVMDALYKGEAHFDELLALTGLDVSALNILLTEMQIKGLITKNKGNYYSI